MRLSSLVHRTIVRKLLHCRPPLVCRWISRISMQRVLLSLNLWDWSDRTRARYTRWYIYIYIYCQCHGRNYRQRCAWSCRVECNSAVDDTHIWKKKNKYNETSEHARLSLVNLGLFSYCRWVELYANDAARILSSSSQRTRRRKREREKTRTEKEKERESKRHTHTAGRERVGFASSHLLHDVSLYSTSTLALLYVGLRVATATTTTACSCVTELTSKKTSTGWSRRDEERARRCCFLD